MANRETYPASQSPLTGDIRGAAGESQVTVVGFQTRPASPIQPPDKSEWRYDLNTNTWFPLLPANIAIMLNGDDVSDDHLIYVNATFTEVNGVVVAP